jgi:hypothetical protein
VAELEQAGRGGGGDGEQERVAGRILSPEPAPEATGEGGAGAARAGDQRQGLPEPDDPPVGPGEVLESARVTRGPLRRREEKGEADHRRRHHVQRAQGGLDGVLEHEAQDHDRDRSDQDEPGQSRLGGTERLPAPEPLHPRPEQLNDVAAKEDQHRSHRAQLDDGVERRPGSCQPNSSGVMRRWAVELMGRNSVMPWTRPRTTARRRPMGERPSCQGPGGAASRRGRSSECRGPEAVEAPRVHPAPAGPWEYRGPGGCKVCRSGPSNQGDREDGSMRTGALAAALLLAACYTGRCGDGGGLDASPPARPGGGSSFSTLRTYVATGHHPGGLGAGGQPLPMDHTSDTRINRRVASNLDAIGLRRVDPRSSRPT